MIRYFVVLLVAVLSIVYFPELVSAQNEDRVGITFGVQTGFEYIEYVETLKSDGQTGEYGGSSTAIVTTASIEFDLQPMFSIPMFVAVSGGIPAVTFSAQDRLVEDMDEGRFLTQTNEVKHEYSRYRAFIGYKFKPVFQPFVLFERALLQSTRWDMKRGTQEGELVPVSPNVTWHERVWSSHLGGGFQGGISLDPEKVWSARFRVAMLFPLASFVTNDHPEVRITDGSLGKNADGVSILSRLALHYNWHEQSSLQFGVNWYYRRWDGSETVQNGQVLSWPPNVMDVFPVLVGFTWSI